MKCNCFFLTEKLSNLGGQLSYDSSETGICLYAKEDLTERNQTYQIDEDESDFFIISQDGDLAYFIKKYGDDNIYEDNGGLVQNNFLNGILETLRVFFRRNE